MNILLVTQYYAPEVGAAQTRLAAVVEYLAGEGHNVRVVTARPSYPTGSVFPGYRSWSRHETQEGSIQIRRVWALPGMGSGLLRILGYLSFMASSSAVLLRDPRPDLVLVESPPLTSVPAAHLVARRYRVPLVMIVSDLWPASAIEIGAVTNQRLIGLLERLETWCYKKARIVSVVTDGITAKLKARADFADRPVLLLPNGVDVDLFAPSSAALPPTPASPGDAAEAEFRIIHPGTIGRMHGLDTAIEAMEILQREGSRIRLFLLGDGSEREKLMERCRIGGLTNVTFHDPVSLREVPEFLRSSQAGLASTVDLPVMRGARPAKLFPLLSAGLPVVYVGVGEGAKLAAESGGALVCAPGDARALADCFRRVASDSELQGKLSAAGRLWAVSNYSWATVISKWWQEVLELLPKASESS